MGLKTNQLSPRGFTLIELLVVITVIAILAGLAFPVFQTAQEQAKRTQAKNDLTQIVTAVNAYYTEYGKYPIDSTAAGYKPADTFYGTGTVPLGITVSTTNDKLLDVIRNNTASTSTANGGGNLVTVLNPRGIVSVSPPDVKTPATPKGGIGIVGTGAPTPLGQFYDPWGQAYCILIDGTYDNQLTNPYTSNAGSAQLRVGVIAWSLGKDPATGSGDKNASPSDDDVISWQ